MALNARKAWRYVGYGVALLCLAGLVWAKNIGILSMACCETGICAENYVGISNGSIDAPVRVIIAPNRETIWQGVVTPGEKASGCFPSRTEGDVTVRVGFGDEDMQVVGGAYLDRLTVNDLSYRITDDHKVTRSEKFLANSLHILPFCRFD